MKVKLCRCKYAVANMQVQICKCKYADANMQVQVYWCKYGGVQMQVKMNMQVNLCRCKYASASANMQVRGEEVIITPRGRLGNTAEELPSSGNFFFHRNSLRPVHQTRSFGSASVG